MKIKNKNDLMKLHDKLLKKYLDVCLKLNDHISAASVAFRNATGDPQAIRDLSSKLKARQSTLKARNDHLEETLLAEMQEIADKHL